VKKVREVHIAPNDPVAGSMKQALGLERRTLFVNVDNLSCGPLPLLGSLEEWQRIRTQYWRSVYTDERDFDLESEFDPLRDVDALRNSESIVLWVGTGTADQLLLAWTVQVLRSFAVPLSRLQVIQFGREPTRGFEVVSLGVLNPDQIRAHPAAARLTAENIAEIDTAWGAVTATNPEPLLAFLTQPQESRLSIP
jgi:hypothetical protein